KVSDVTEDPHVARELVLVKVHAPAARRGDISSLAEVFGARIADVAHDSLMLELTASPDKIESFVELVRPFGIKEMVRTGRVAMVRGTPMHAADTYVRVA
ncbi:MAG TPA: acetolactate synthase small subunit, partial [Herpetosiphonaceae bacterium]|nr:acetolactate synthase small subunit [Herpetosiphonaceae bacterium]